MEPTLLFVVALSDESLLSGPAHNYGMAILNFSPKLLVGKVFTSPSHIVRRMLGRTNLNSWLWPCMYRCNRTVFRYEWKVR